MVVFTQMASHSVLMELGLPFLRDVGTWDGSGFHLIPLLF